MGTKVSIENINFLKLIMDIQEILKNKINNLDEAANKIDSEKQIKLLFEGLVSKDDKYRYNCLLLLEKITIKKVSWIYERWDFLVSLLDSPNSYHRNIGLILLANLSLSDSENRFENILDKYLSHCNDEKFITQGFLHKSGGFVFFLPALGLLGLILLGLRKWERGKRRG